MVVNSNTFLTIKQKFIYSFNLYNLKLYGEIMVKKRSITTTIITFAIIAILIFTPPGAGLLVELSGPSESTVGSTVNFQARIVIQSALGEWTNITGINLVVEKNGKKDIIFLPVNLTPNSVVVGSKSLVNTNSEIISIKVNPETNATYGYNYGYAYIENGTGYGYGSRYGYGYASSNAVIVYDISWKPSETGTYNFEFKVMVSDDSGNTKEFTASHTITVNPVSTVGYANLEVSPTSISKEITAGNSVNVTITVSNTGNEELRNVNYYVTGDTANWVSFTPANISSIPAYGSSDITAIISIPSTTPQGEYNGNIKFTSENGGTEEIPVTIKVLPAPVPTTPPVTPGKEIYSEVKTFLPNTKVEIKLPAQKEEETGIVRISAKLPKEMKVNVIISKLPMLPSYIPKPKVKEIYKVVDITFTEYETNITVEPSAYIEFKVSKNWINEKGYKPEDIVVMKYDKEWKELPTQLIGKDENYYYYKTQTGNFSIFAIAVKPTVTPEEQPTQPSKPQPKKPTQPEQPTKPTPPYPIIAIIILLAIVIAIAYFVWQKKK